MQRATVKLMLKENKQNSLGQCPIYLKITANSKRSYISTGYYIFKRQWDEANESVKSNHDSYEAINRDILRKKTEALDQILQSAIDKRFATASTLKEVVSKDLKNIFKFSDKLISEVAHRRSGATIDNYKKHLKKLKEFSGEVTFEQITPDLLRQFETWLLENVNKRSDNPSNYIAAIMRTIRGHFNEAISRGLTKNYPFKTYKLPKETPGNKDFLSLAELKKFHEFTFSTEHPVYKELSLYFLFACYTGLRLSDWKDFAEAKLRGRNISVQATKNKVWVNVPLHDGLVQVIQRMKQVPLKLKEPTINRKLKDLCKELKIKKKLSTHSGRRTFAVTMCLERGMSSETTAKLMGITLAVFEKSYSFVSAEKIMLETSKAWKDILK